MPLRLRDGVPTCLPVQLSVFAIDFAALYFMFLHSLSVSRCSMHAAAALLDRIAGGSVSESWRNRQMLAKSGKKRLWLAIGRRPSRQAQGWFPRISPTPTVPSPVDWRNLDATAVLIASPSPTLPRGPETLAGGMPLLYFCLCSTFVYFTSRGYLSQEWAGATKAGEEAVGAGAGGEEEMTTATTALLLVGDSAVSRVQRPLQRAARADLAHDAGSLCPSRMGGA